MNGECCKSDFKDGKTTFLPVSFQRYARLTQNNHQSAQKLTENTVKQVSKPVKQRFYVYLGNVTTDWRKLITKVLKKERRMP